MAAVWRWAELRVEVLRDIGRWEVERKVTPELTVLPLGEDIRRSLLLCACPYLQHLDLVLATRHFAEPKLDETFALVPRLRTLRLDENPSEDSDWKQHPIRLDRPPQLTSLRCRNSAPLASLPYSTSRNTRRSMTCTSTPGQLCMDE